MSHHIFIYGLAAIATVAYFLLFGFGGFVAWGCIRRMPKDEKKEKGQTKEEED
jgi:hypothetical protein